MGRMPGGVTKKINDDDDDALLLKVQAVNKNPSPIAKDVTTEAMTALTEVAVLENGSLQKKTPTRRSQRLHHATSPSQDFGILSELGHVDVLVLEGTEGSGNEAEQDFPQSLNVEKKESEEMERLFKLVQEQQRRIDELAAGKSFSSQDLSEGVIRLEAKVNKYMNMCVDSQKKIRGLQKKRYDLSKKLARANAKLEGYEMGQRIFCRLIDSLKDATLAKSTVTLLEHPSTGNTSDTPKHSTQTKPQAAKRKKVSDIVQLLTETKSQAAKRKKLVTIKGDGTSLASKQK